MAWQEFPRHGSCEAQGWIAGKSRLVLGVFLGVVLLGCSTVPRVWVARGMRGGRAHEMTGVKKNHAAALVSLPPFFIGVNVVPFSSLHELTASLINCGQVNGYSSVCGGLSERSLGKH
jgi:hypothetical protein